MGLRRDYYEDRSDGKTESVSGSKFRNWFIVARRDPTGQDWKEIQGKNNEPTQTVHKGQNEDYGREQGDVEGWSGELVHVVQVDSMVSETHLSIMNGFVAREKVADMTCRTQVKSGGKRGRPIKHSACLCLCMSCDANNTHAHTCSCVLWQETKSCDDHFKRPHVDPVCAVMYVNAYGAAVRNTLEVDWHRQFRIEPHI